MILWASVSTGTFEHFWRCWKIEHFNVLMLKRSMESATNWFCSDSWSKAGILLGCETAGEGRKVSKADREKRRPPHIHFHQHKVTNMQEIWKKYESNMREILDRRSGGLHLLISFYVWSHIIHISINLRFFSSVILVCSWIVLKQHQKETMCTGVRFIYIILYHSVYP